MMKIIHFISGIDKSGGGTTAYMKLLAEELNKYSIDQKIATGISDSPVEIVGVQIHFFDLKNLNPLHLKRVAKLKNEFSRYLKNQKPDIVHINGVWLYQNYIFQKEAQKLNIKVVLSPHGMLEPYIINRNKLKKKIALFLFQDKAILNSDFLHVTAKSELENIKKIGYKNKNYTIIPNGIEIKNRNPKEYAGEKEYKHFLFLSRVHPKKGIDILIDTVASLRDSKIKITIAGNGEKIYINQLIKYTIEKNVSDIFNFVGPVYGEEKWSLFKSADVFILPTHSENFGIVVAESLLVGVPVITTKGTPWEELNINKCGWWVDLTVNSLKKTIREAINLPDTELKAMGLRGRKLIKNKYNISNVATAMKSFYESILKKEI